MDRPPDLSEGAQDTKTTAVPDSAENTSKPALDHKNVPPEDIPDPDEDDLDDLDDILDDFSAKAGQKSVDPISKSELIKDTPGTFPPPGQVTSEEDELAGKLESGMEDLLKDMQSSPEMQKQFEELMKNLGIADEPNLGLAGEHGRETPPKAGEDTFQKTIQKTMERMQESGEQASAAVNADESGDILAEMLKQIEGGGLKGPENEEDFSKMILGMMEQLTNKDILYDPMKELNDKYPAWMANHQTSTKAEDMQRYKEQQVVVSEIVARFEAPGYADTNTADREYIVERMQKMQAAGSPPPDLVGDMSAAQEALGDLDSGCPQQ